VNLILLERDEVNSNGDAVLDGTRAEHLRSVLNAAPAQTVRVGLVDGPFGVGTVTAISETAVRLGCTFEPEAPPRPPVDLLLALPRPKVMRRLWAQLAALGVGRVILTNATRVERNYFDTHFLTPEIYRPLLIEGLQQARDTRVPLVSIHRRFRVLIEDELDALCGGALRVSADPSPGAFRLKPEATIGKPEGMIGKPEAMIGRVVLAVGPEGGWNDFERGLLEAHRFQPVSMGTRTLRSDTACVALLTLVHHALASA
jgi:16S rRNA (uracil1498-N3)-methyltransferase